MHKNETALAAPSDIATALGLLSRLPVPPPDTERTGAAAWAYPVAGLILGSLAALAGAIAHAFGLPSPLTALIALGFLILATGAMHEDGLADTADGLWGGWTRDRRLEIMKDSHIGTYGVVALVLSLAARWAALTLLYDQGSGAAAAALIVAAALSRAAMPLLMARLPHARDHGLSHSVGPVPMRTAWLALAIAALAALLLTGWSGLPVILWALAAALAMGVLARSMIGGQTGDILGATQQVAEIAILFSLIA
ncbi:MAG: adenosylcobinamide-GDP ribazoletransferase [Phycisphaerales bacterium]